MYVYECVSLSAPAYMFSNAPRKLGGDKLCMPLKKDIFLHRYLPGIL